MSTYLHLPHYFSYRLEIYRFVILSHVDVFTSTPPTPPLIVTVADRFFNVTKNVTCLFGLAVKQNAILACCVSGQNQHVNALGHLDSTYNAYNPPQSVLKMFSLKN